MHKYLEDHWADGDHIVNLVFLICLPEMKMFLDTNRLIAKQTDNIVDELWNYIHNEKFVEAAILLLAAQKQLRGYKRTSQVSLNRFAIIKSHFDEALDTLHLEMLTMVHQEGKEGTALKKLKDKKEALLTARVSHEEIVEHISSILTSNGIVYSRKSIDTGNLEWFGMQAGSLACRRDFYLELFALSTVEKKLKKEGILVMRPPIGVAIKEVRNMFVPYWISVLSHDSSLERLLSAEASKKGTKNSMKNLGSNGWPQLASNYKSKRMFCAVASMSRKVLLKHA
ncbi:hypothetical protein BS78_06G117300 [Paspalum vaginatum]|nr:hypothetical protein BS78_06G117300 [Paspalum vaginatum]